jgi:hypothetical protein
LDPPTDTIEELDPCPASANIRESLTNANAAAANLADATEALKHNFLTRGFFKNRGYYSLAELSPDEYRQDRTLARRTARSVVCGCRAQSCSRRVMMER